MEKDTTINALIEKFKNIYKTPETYLEGLLHAKPLNYWDYLETDILLSLQKPRTHYKDEESFILYNQITELILKLILHELKQVTGNSNPCEAVLIEKLNRINNYTKVIISFFGVMKEGMSYEDYNSFRTVLAPASGFQSVQFRQIELHCTSLENLINEEGKKRLSVNSEIEECFNYIYWKDAGLNRATGEQTYTLRQFEEKYIDGLIVLAKKIKGHTLEDKVCRLRNPSPGLQENLRAFDRLYNIEWPSVHLHLADHYLNKDGQNAPSTGNSAWKEYLHPKLRQRFFFPSLWSDLKHNNRGNVSININ